MTAEHKNSENIPDKKILDKCITALEIAIEQIKKIENGEPLECKEINPNGFKNCPGSSDKAFIDVCQKCSKYTDYNEPAKLREKALISLETELLSYVKETYKQGYKNGSDKIDYFENDIERNLRVSLFDIIEKWQLSQNITILK